MTSAQWARHYDEMAQSFRQYQRLYARGCPATQVVAVEQNWLRLLPGVLSEAEHLPASAGAADELFTSLWVRLCHTSPEFQQQGLDQLRKALTAITDTASAELLAIAAALHLAQTSDLPLDWQAIAELCQPCSKALPALMNLSWPEAASAQVATWWPEGLQAALQQLYQQHQAEALLALPDEALTDNAITALGLALQLGEAAALPRLQSLETNHTEAVLGAYWISGQRDAAGLLLDALRTPHKAKIAARYWALYSGQSLEWVPAMGLVGSEQKQGIELPDADQAEQWWQQSTADKTALWQGNPVTNESIHQALSQHWGRPIAPLWALWQFQQRKLLPDPLTQWHSDRLAILAQLSREAASASG